MKIINKFKKLIYIILSTAVVALFSSCPPEVTAPMVALVEDSLSPTINITSPNGGDNYYSTVTVTGIITDDVLTEDDTAGSITSIYYEIANDDYRKGKIDIDLDDTVTTDTDFGTETITYDVTTGYFSFTFSSISPTKLRDLMSLSITAVDGNNNSITQELNLLESDGPYVEFGFYDDAAYGDENIITSLDGNRVYIKGTVGNSEYESDSADEIAEISWSIEGGGNRGGTLDITDGSDDWIEADGIFRTTNNVDTTKYFTYDPDTRTFTTQTQIDVSEETRYINFTATDIYGHSTTETNSISKPADFELYTNTAANLYFSPNTDSADTTISVPFLLIDPNQDEITSSRISKVTCSLSSTGSDTTPADWDDYDSATDTFTDYFTVDGGSNYQATFNVDIASDSTFYNYTGNLWLIVTVTTIEGTDESTLDTSYLIYNDSDYPSVTVNSFSGGTSNYVARDDALILDFTVSDTGAGVDDITSVVINGEDATSAVSKSGNNYSVSYTIPSGATSDADGEAFGYTITAYDAAGNPISGGENLTAKTLYGPYSSNSFSIDSSGAYTNSGNNTWARAVSGSTTDTVTVYFASPRVLASTPSVSIAGRVADSVTYNSGTSLYTATLALDGTNETTVDLNTIYIQVTSTDIANNTETLSLPTAVSYDKTAPLTPAAPLWGGSYAPYINATDMGGTNLTFTGYRSLSGANSADSVELYLDASGGASIGSANFSDTTTSSISVTFVKGNIGGTGAKTIYSRVKDQAGNFSAYSAVENVTVDTAIDSLSVGTTSYSGTTSKKTDFDHTDASANDSSGIASYTWSIDGPTTLTDYSYSTTTDDLSVSAASLSGGDGLYTAELEVIDGAGNEQTTSFTFIWDTTGPVVSGLPTSDVGYNTDISQTASVSDGTNSSGVNESTYSWDLIGQGDNAGTDYSDVDNDTTLNVAINSINDGEYLARLTVYDNISNQGQGSYTFFKDQNAPTITPASDPSGYMTGSFTHTATMDDGAGSGIDWGTLAVNKDSGSGTVSSSTSYVEATGVATATISSCSADGSYTMYYYIKDISNNATTNIAANQFSFFWDSNAPAYTTPLTDLASATKSTISKTATPTDGTGSGLSTYSWSFSDNDNSDGVGTVTSGATNTTDISITDCSIDGSYTATITVYDVAGLNSTDDFTFYWDETGPAITHDSSTTEEFREELSPIMLPSPNLPEQQV